ncbi:MAG: GxxExxY protein [Gemmatimonas sp.]
MNTLPLDEVTGTIIASAMRVHSRFKNGMLESAYERMLARLLYEAGLDVRRQVPVSFDLDGTHFQNAFRVDLLVNETVIVEVKVVERLQPIHQQQVLTYLRLMNLKVGLLLNFREEHLKDGIKRVVNDLPPDDSPLLRVNHPN